MFKTKGLGALLTLFTLLTVVAILTGCGGSSSSNPFTTGKPGGSSGSAGTLTLTDAPANTEGMFVATEEVSNGTNPLGLGWGEITIGSTHLEALIVNFFPAGVLSSITFRSQDGTSPSIVTTDWQCSSDCSGVSIDQTAGTITFTNTVLTAKSLVAGTTPPNPITLNGTLNFTPVSGGTPDTTAPTVLTSSLSPAKDATNVPVTTAITATFSEPMLASSITPTSFFINGISGAVTYNSTTYTATFTPAINLAPNTTYTVVITTGVQDASNNANALATDVVWSFDTGAAPDPSEIKGNNSAQLSGAAIGSGTTAVADLRKPITVTDLGPDPSFSVGTAYATRTTTILDYAYIIFPVTNIGTETLCLIELTGITYRDAGDMELLSGGLTYVQGSVGKTPSLQFTDTCLAPGETGMVRTINNNLYAAVAKMEFTFSTIASTISVPAAKVIPQSYTIASSTLTIVAKNVGTRNALVGEQNRFHSWVLLDDAMHPLTFGLTNITTPSIIAPDGTATISTSISYAGSGSKLLVSTNFEDTILSASAILASSVISPTATAQCATSLSPDELAMCRIESRNRAIEALQTSAQ